MAHVGLHEEIDTVSAQIAADPDAADLWQRRGELRRIHGDRTLAQTDFQHARKLDAALPTIDLAEARLHVDTGDYRRALPLLNRFLAREPHNVRGLITRAQARRGLGQHLSAAEDYRLAIETFIPPRKPTPEFYIERARALIAAGPDQTDAAVQCLDAGIVGLGPVITLEQEALRIERDAGRFDAALVRIDRITTLTPRDEAWLALRGGILQQSGRPALAHQAYEDALRAINALPAHKRATRSVQHLRAQVEAGLRE